MTGSTNSANSNEFCALVRESPSSKFEDEDEEVGQFCILEYIISSNEVLDDVRLLIFLDNKLLPLFLPFEPFH